MSTLPAEALVPAAEPGERVDPRVVRTRATVLAATRDELAEGGFGSLCIDGVAKRSGVARTTIYRHWPSVAVLAHEAFRELAEPAPDIDTGSVRDDLLTHLRWLRTALEHSEWGRLLPHVLAASHHDPELAELHRAFGAERRRPALAAVARAVERGELAAGLDADALVDRLAGPLFYRCLVRLQPTTDADLEALVDGALGDSSLVDRALSGRAAR